MAIRFAVLEDLPQILSIYAPYVTDTAVSFEYSVPTLEAFTQRYHAITRQFPWLVWEENHTVLGYAYGGYPFERAAYQWCAEPSVYLHPDARRRGIGRALYQALESILKQQGYCKLYAIITSQNQASLDFHLAMGYQSLAVFPNCGFKHNQWYGITWMEKQLNPVEMPMNVPIPIRELVKTNTNFTII